MKIVTHKNAYHLATKIGHVAKVKRKRFPDGEIYLRLMEDVEDPVVLASMYPNQNDSLVELLAMVEALNEPRVVLAYMAYSRQDRQFLPGEAVSSRIVIESLKALGASEVYVVEPHSKLALHNFAKPIYIHETLADRINSNIEEPLVISPDFGRSELVERIAKVYGFDYTFLKKYRDRETGEIKTEGEIDARGRNVVIVDDIISTGGTVENAIKLLSGQAKSIQVVIIHGLFVESALWRVNVPVATTDTVMNPYMKISVAKDIKEVLNA